MPDEHEDWKARFRAFLRTKPKKKKPVPAQPARPAAPPGFGPAKSIGPVAPVMRAAEQVAAGSHPERPVSLAELMIAPKKKPTK